MEKYFLLIAFFALSSFFGCKKADEPAEESFVIRFQNPQPINDSELSKFPSKFRGLFMNPDSMYVNIKENIILKEYFYRFRFHKNQMDSIKNGFDFVGNQYKSKLNNDIYDYKYIGDSIEFSNKQIDTFFVFSDTQKAKRIDGQLILNYKDSIFWKIKAISLEKNSLRIKYLNSGQDLKRIDSLTKVKSTMIDSSRFIIKPSRNEFKRIINLKKLGEELDYKRVVK